MTRRFRIGFFALSAGGLAALLLWAVAGLPDFGHYHHAYGRLLNSVAVGERHATNVVTATVFDYRGFDTLGEEFILFTSVVGVALLLRDVREERRRPPDRVLSDAVRLAGAGFSAALLVLGLYVVALLLALLGSALAIATARAIRLRERGTLESTPAERERAEHR